MSVFQIVAILFALCMVYVVHIHRRKATLSASEVSFWYSSWFLFMVMALFPFLLTGIAGVLSFSRVFDLLVVLSFMLLSTVVMYTYFTQKELGTKLEEIVRRRTLEIYGKKKIT